MKKAFDQTVRDLKREVNKKVLKVPQIEQKILDATSNEPWGPHGSVLADIALATRNHHEYQMIMNVIWKRINDTGKNWRHVYKGLTVLEYLVAHGSERVIDDIKEHHYQIATLADFQYIDSSGRDQGNNVRRKSQSLVALVNNKERIQEVRQKAAANRDKYRGSYPTGRPGSYPGPGGGYGDRYDDDRYGDPNGYGYGRDRDRDREREWGGYNRDDDRYARGGSDPYTRDNNYGRESDENYGGRDSNYREDDYRGSRGSDGYSARNRNSFDRERDRPYDDDDRYSSRSGGGRADDSSLDERGRLERKLSEPNMAAPPSYEEAVSDAQLPSHEERNGGNGISSPPAPRLETSPAVAAAANNNTTATATATAQAAEQSVPAPAHTKEVDGFDEFDPRGSFSAASAAAPAVVPPAAASAGNSVEMDLFGSDPINSLALVPMTSTTSQDDVPPPPVSGFETNSTATPFGAMPSASFGFDQGGANPFGDSPFKAIPAQEGIPPAHPVVQQQAANMTATAAVHSFQPPVTVSADPPPAPVAAAPGFDFGDALGGITYTPPPLPPNMNMNANGNVPFQEHSFGSGGGPAFMATGMPPNPNPNHNQQQVAPAAAPFLPMQQTSQNVAALNNNGLGFQQTVTGPQPGSAFLPPQASSYAPAAAAAPTPFAPLHTTQSVPNLLNPPSLGQTGSGLGIPPQQPPTRSSSASLISSLEIAQPQPQPQPQPEKKFETKSTVWADTLSRGLVNLNISGPKINPHADIGIDFDSMNRKEKREEKRSASAAAPVVSTVTMGKAMGAGSSVGRASASGLAPPPNPMAGTGMGMGMGMGMGSGRGMGMGGAGYGGGMNQPMGGMGAGAGVGMGMGMGMGMNVGMGMGVGMNMGMPMRPMGGGGMPPVGYNNNNNNNPMMGSPYTSQQQPYGGGGYR